MCFARILECFTAVPPIAQSAGPFATQIGEMGVIPPVRPDSHQADITELVAQSIQLKVVDIRPVKNSTIIYFYGQFSEQINFYLTLDPQVWGYNCRENNEFVPLISKRMIDLFSRLANNRVCRTWRGMYSITPDGFTIIDWIDQL